MIIPPVTTAITQTGTPTTIPIDIRTSNAESTSGLIVSVGVTVVVPLGELLRVAVGVSLAVSLGELLRDAIGLSVGLGLSLDVSLGELLRDAIALSVGLGVLQTGGLAPGSGGVGNQTKTLSEIRPFASSTAENANEQVPVSTEAGGDQSTTVNDSPRPEPNKISWDKSSSITT
jgi:hypothetical protein